MYRRSLNALLAALLAITALVVPLGGAPVLPAPVAHAQASLPPLPAGWPTTLQIGRGAVPAGPPR